MGWYTKQEKAQMKKQREKELNKSMPQKYAIKGESLFERARKYGIACNDENIGNRAKRREEIRRALKK